MYSTTQGLRKIIVISLVLFLNIKGHALDCPSVTHLVTIEGERATVPDGFFVYGVYNQGGVYISKTRNYSPQILSHTSADNPLDIAISSNGKWILYNASGAIYLLRLYPACKIRVPLAVALPWNVCFWRNQPNGEEAICYMVNPYNIRAVTVTYTKDTVLFGNDRPIVALGDSLNILPARRLCISSDHLFSALHPYINGSFYAWTSGYMTIPQKGQGIAGPGNFYKWANDTFVNAGGCAHALSWDGSQCAADVGTMSLSPCIPRGHKGFTQLKPPTQSGVDIGVKTIWAKHGRG